MSRPGSPSHERLRWAIEQRHARLALLAAAELQRVPPRDALELSLLLLDAEARREAAAEAPRRPVVLVAGDEPLLVRGAALLLDRARELDAMYVGSAARARRFVRGGGSQVIAWAGDHLDAGTIGHLHAIRETCPGTGLCLLARRIDGDALQELAEQSVERLAFAFHSERLDARDFVELIRSVLRGRSTIDPALLRRLPPERGEPEPEPLELTDSEREVMDLVAAGLRNREIGRRLWKSEKAVEKQVGRLFQKLGLPPGASTHLDRRVTATRIYLARQAERRQGLAPAESFEPPPAAP